MSKQEQVLCFNRSLLDELGSFQGINLDPDKYLPKIMDPANLFYRQRDLVETDETVKQVIAYVILASQPRDALVFRYRRGKSGGENRLHGLYSIGVGGHIANTDTAMAATDTGYNTGLIREIREETGLAMDIALTLPPVALINDDSTPVGRVHFGVVHMLMCKGNVMLAPCEDLVDPKFVGVVGAMEHAAAYETWSELCLNNFLSLTLAAADRCGERDEKIRQ